MRAIFASQSRVAFARCLQHRFEIKGRAADDLEHVGGGGLLLERFGQIVGALMQFLKQSGILDGDDRLGREISDQLDLLVGERPDFRAVDDKAPTSSSSLHMGSAMSGRAPPYLAAGQCIWFGASSAAWTSF